MQIALDVIHDIEDRIGWPQSETIESPELTAKQRKLLRLMNRVLGLWTGLSAWPLLRAEGTLVLVAAETSDTTSGSEQYVTATQSSDVLTIANITLDETYKERAILISGTNYVYRIIDVPSATTLQLNRAWVDDSITVADTRTFTIGADRYALPDNYDRPAGPIQAFFGPYGVRPMSPNDLLAARMGAGISTGEPETFTIYGMNAGETHQLIHLDPYPESARMLTFPYQRKHGKIDSDNDKIFIQDRYMEAFIEMVTQIALRDYEDDEKTQIVLADMIRAFNQQEGSPELTEQPLVIRPLNQTRADIRMAARGCGRSIDWGTYFDRVENTGLR